ncbi:MAG TPA: hypothetical protein VFO40_28285 [Chthoniobacterales bacterium]|nr:hypothetical protein [Chthoniobacterales bacterium]
MPTTNGDEERYADKRASFAKSLPHTDQGEVEPGAYADWLSILASGDPARFEYVPRDPLAIAKLNNPQATYAFDLVGIDSHATRLIPPPPLPAARWPSKWRSFTGKHWRLTFHFRATKRTS